MNKTTLPRLMISQDQLPILERLAEGLDLRQPDLADRLIGELSRAEIRPEAELPQDVIRLGSHVTFRDETNGRVQSVTLVMPQEADIDAGKVSVTTPIGVALIGLSTGSRFGWEARNGQPHELSVLSVES